MEQQGENISGSTREERLEWGYQALQTGSWEQAKAIFGDLLQEDPGCGLSCLGRALAEKQIHGREELAENWQTVRTDPVFREALNSAPPDLIEWLRADMEQALQDAEESREEEGSHSEKKHLFPAVSRGRKILLGFAGVQVILYLVMTFLFAANDTDPGEILMNFFGGLIVTAGFSGLPVIFGPLYGNSIVKGGRFRRLFKILNNLTAVPGAGIYAMLTVAGWMTVRESRVPERMDQFYVAIFFLAFLIHLLSLIVPAILNAVEKED